MTHRYCWGNNPKRRGMKGRQCKLLAVGKMNSVLVEFENGQKECVSRRAIRRVKRSGQERDKPHGRGAYNNGKQ